MRRCLLASITLALAVFSVTTAGQSVDPELTAAIAARDKAAIDRDVAAMAKYTADDYVAINPSGARITKQFRLNQLKAPAAPGSKPSPPIRVEAAHMYGADAAVVRAKQEGNRQILVWIKNPSGWQAVAVHVVPDTITETGAPQERLKTAEPSATIAPPGLSGEAAAVFAAHKQAQDAYYSANLSARDSVTAPQHVRLVPGMLTFAAERTRASDGLPRKQPKFSNTTVQVWGQVAVVRWLETETRVQWFTRVLAKTASGWQQVATASSPAANPPIAP